jgi:hypothetical protein
MKLTEAEQQALVVWVQHRVLEMQTRSDTKVLANYVKALVSRDVPPGKLKAILSEFVGPQAGTFVDELQLRLEKRDFTIQPATAPPPPPAPARPAPARPPAPPAPAEPPPAPPKSPSPPARPLSPPAEPPSPPAKPPSPPPKAPTAPAKPPAKPPAAPAKPPPDSEVSDRDSEPRSPPRIASPGPPPRRGKWAGYEAPRRRRARRRDFDSDLSEAEEKSQTEIEVEMMEPPPRYVIYVAGLEPNLNSISHLYTQFQKFGQIITIETILSENVAFIEFADLLSAFKAVVAKKNPLNNSFIKIGYAFDPDQQDLEALEAERQRRKVKCNEVKKKEATEDDENRFMDDLLEKMTLLINQMEAETDPVKKEGLRRTLDELNSIASEL